MDTNDRGYDVGHYFGNLKEAQADMLERASNELNIDLHEKWYNEFMENDILCALSEFLSDDEVEQLKMIKSLCRKLTTYIKSRYWCRSSDN